MALDAATLKNLIQQATPTDQWRTQECSNGGRLLLRGKGELPLSDRHPQTHLQMVPAVDADLTVYLVSHAPEILQLIAELAEAKRAIMYLEAEVETENNHP